MKNHTDHIWSRVIGGLLLLSVLGPQVPACAQGTAFSYQGRLNDGDSPANGSYDLRFILFTAEVGGSQQGSILTMSSTLVSNGLFTVTLDFGNQFPGADRWLDIAVRTNGAGVFTPLALRVKINAVPYVITATTLTGMVPATGLSGTYSSALTLNNAANSFSGNGAGLTALNASQLASGLIPDTRVGSGTYANALTLNNAANTLSGSGVGLTTLDASQLTTGAVPDARLAGTYSSALTLNNVANSFSGNGSLLTALSASQLGSETIPSARLAGTYSSTLTLSSAANSFTGNGAGLTALNASQLTSGTVPAARLTGSAALLDTAQTFTADKSFGSGAQALVDTGSKAAPGFAFQGDLDTGIFEPGANVNVLALATGSGERLRVDSSGRVGIGTTNPANRLTVAGAGSAILLTNTTATGHGWMLGPIDFQSTFQLYDTTVGGNAGVRLSIRTNGYVGIDESFPQVPLHVAGGGDVSLSGGGYLVAGSVSGSNLAIDSNEILARNNGQAADLYLNRFGGSLVGGGSVIFGGSRWLLPEDDNSQKLGASGNRWQTVYSANGFIQTSDGRLKDHIKPVRYGLETILSLRPVSFQWKQKPERGVHLGLIAQEVEPIIPEAVVQGDQPEHPCGMNYNAFIPILVKAVQQRQAQIEGQRAANAGLKQRLEKLERLAGHRAELQN